MCRKILKIEKNPVVNSECWTYYKLAVIETSENFNEWLLCHLSLYINQAGIAVFGENGIMYPITYFEDILDITDVDIFSVKDDEIVDFIIKQINNNRYVILDLNYDRLFYKENTTSFWLHETLIYGYDSQTKKFITPVMTNSNFEELEIDFDTIRLAFLEAQKYFSQERKRIYNRRHWYYGITIINGLKKYHNSNIHYEFIKRLKLELENASVIKQVKSIDGLRESRFYTGIGVISHLSTLIHAYIENNEKNDYEFEKYKNSALKLFESQKIIERTIWWMGEFLRIRDKEFKKLLAEYKACCNEMHITVLLFHKYKFSKHDQILEKIKINLDSIRIKEEEILTKLVEKFENKYIDELNKCYVNPLDIS